MDEFEIACVVQDINGNISHYGVKGYGIQNVAIIERLITERACSFFVLDNGKKRMYMQEFLQTGQYILPLTSMTLIEMVKLFTTA